jgi:hypothetical protein
MACPSLVTFDQLSVALERHRKGGFQRKRDGGKNADVRAVLLRCTRRP